MMPDLTAIVRLGETDHMAAERLLSEECTRNTEELAAACLALLERGTEQEQIRLLLLLKVVPYSVAAPLIEAGLALAAERPVAAALDALESFLAGGLAPTPLIERAINRFAGSQSLPRGDIAGQLVKLLVITERVDELVCLSRRGLHEAVDGLAVVAAPAASNALLELRRASPEIAAAAERALAERRQLEATQEVLNLAEGEYLSSDTLDALLTSHRYGLLLRLVKQGALSEEALERVQRALPDSPPASETKMYRRLRAHLRSYRAQS